MMKILIIVVSFSNFSIQNSTVIA